MEMLARDKLNGEHQPKSTRGSQPKLKSIETEAHSNQISYRDSETEREDQEGTLHVAYFRLPFCCHVFLHLTSKSYSCTRFRLVPNQALHITSIHNIPKCSLHLCSGCLPQCPSSTYACSIHSSTNLNFVKNTCTPYL